MWLIRPAFPSRCARQPSTKVANCLPQRLISEDVTQNATSKEQVYTGASMKIHELTSLVVINLFKAYYLQVSVTKSRRSTCILVTGILDMK